MKSKPFLQSEKNNTCHDASTRTEGMLCGAAKKSGVNSAATMQGVELRFHWGHPYFVKFSSKDYNINIVCKQC